MKMVATLLVLLCVFVVATLVYSGATSWSRTSESAREKIPVGILGDSDSQSYQGRPPLGSTHSPAGGAHHKATFQWPEVLARIRGEQVELGEWAYWGVPRALSMARVRDGLGLRWRGPRKEDYRHNLAWASGCAELHQGAWRQAQRLVDIMDEDRAWWARGVVIIRSGVNDIGKESLDALAENPKDPVVQQRIDECVQHIRRAVVLIRTNHPSTALVLVGIFNNAHWSPYLDKFRSAKAMGNIDMGLDRFDAGLRSITNELPKVAFFDDRAWFAAHWGRRDANGLPNYRTVRVGSTLQVANTEGDSPDNATLANGHAGLVWNALWVQSLVSLLQTNLNMSIRTITDREVGDFVDVSRRAVP